MNILCLIFQNHNHLTFDEVVASWLSSSSSRFLLWKPSFFHFKRSETHSQTLRKTNKFDKLPMKKIVLGKHQETNPYPTSESAGWVFSRILLMDQILHQLRLAVHPIIYRVLYIPSGHQQYVIVPRRKPFLLWEKKDESSPGYKKDSKNRNQNKASNLVVATHLNHQCEKHAQVKLDCLFSGPVENSKTCLKFHHLEGLGVNHHQDALYPHSTSQHPSHQ